MPPRVALEPGTTAFAGNDYLGLAKDPRLAEALCRAAREHGVSCISSRWALGWQQEHAELEGDLRGFFGTEDAAIFGSAFVGGLAFYQAVAESHPAVFCDEHGHTTHMVGIRAAGLPCHSYRHLDPEDLRRRLQAHDGPPPIVATDGMFSISGDLAPLKDIHAVAREFGAPLFVDDAHGVFALGDDGRGSAQLCGLQPGDATILGSSSKALGANGGFLVGAAELIERCRRTPVASATAHPPTPIAAATREGIRIVAAEPERRRAMLRHAELMRETLSEAGIGVACTDTPIVAALLADAADAESFSQHLRRHDLVAPYFTYPSEPRANLLRMIARADYTDEVLNRFRDAVRSWRGGA